jgi:hypothetical protein
MNALLPTDAGGSLSARARRSAVRDCFYHWFSELEARGEDATFRLGRVREGQAEPSWTCLPHHTFDGLGGLHYVLAQAGEQLELPVLAGPYPGLLERSLAAFRVLASPAPQLLWFERQVATARDARPLSAWRLFTAGETSALRERARSHGTSLNAFFLSHLTTAIRPLLSNGPGVISWVIPVNMRGFEPALAATDNQAATLDVFFPVHASARAIDQRIREQLRAKAHWGVWQLLAWLGAAGPRVIRFVARRELERRKHGSFSNLGALRVARSSVPDEPEWWMAINPVQRARPLGAACLTVNGRLTLTLQAHAVLGLAQGALRAVMDAWVDALLQPPSAESRSTAGTTTLAPRSGGTNFT